MKRRIIVAIVLVVAAFFVGRQVNRLKAVDEPGRREMRQSYRLDPGARVEVKGINGSVEIKTAGTDTADVRVTYAGGSPEDQHVVSIEHTPSELVVRGDGRGGDFWRWLRGEGRVRVAVVLTVPRQIEVTAKGVNGPLKVGEVEGSLTVSGVNGSVRLGVARLGEQGVEVKGVNGNVEIRLASAVDADLEVKGLNGRMDLNVPHVTMQEREGHSRMRARLGAGGTPITFKGVNGNVRFGSDAGAAATSSVPPPPPPAPVAPPAPREF